MVDHIVSSRYLHARIWKNAHTHKVINRKREQKKNNHAKISNLLGIFPSFRYFRVVLDFPLECTWYSVCCLTFALRLLISSQWRKIAARLLYLYVCNISVEHTSNVCLSMVFDLIAYFCQYFHFIDMSSPIGIMMPFTCSTPTTYYHLVWWINVIKSNLHHCCWQNNFNMIKLNGTKKKLTLYETKRGKKAILRKWDIPILFVPLYLQTLIHNQYWIQQVGGQ